MLVELSKEPALGGDLAMTCEEQLSVERETGVSKR
jgi:hypothetical protein